MHLSEKVLNFTDENALFQYPCTVLLGLSGGADSMALLHILHHWPRGGLRVVAVHVHHGIRGDEADRDEAFVRRECAALGVPLPVVHRDVPSIAEEAHLGLEEAGRQVRYQVFADLVQELGANYIATAHTASDQAETVLLHMLRGCGTAGLCGIPVRRNTIVRPLLSCSREEIETYCRAEHIPYVQDSTNSDSRYTRNALRHRVIPLLQEINPGAKEALLRMSAAASEDNECLEAMAEEALAKAWLAPGQYRLAAFAHQPRAVAGRMVRLALAQQGCRSMEYRHTAWLWRAMEQGSGRLELPGGYSLALAKGVLHVACSHTAQIEPLPETLRVTAFPYVFEWNGQRICLEQVEHLDKNVHKMFFKYTCDYDKIQGDLSVRCRLAGDAMHPAGRHVGKSVKTIMNEQQLPVGERPRYPIVCDSEGIVLVPGICCDERVRTDEHTKHFLVWRLANELP